MSIKEIDHMIWKVLSDEASPQEKEMLEKWASSSDANAAAFNAMKAAWEGTKIRERYSNQAAVFKKIDQHIRARQPGPVEHQVGRRANWTKYAGIAASILVVFILTFAFYHETSTSPAAEAPASEMITKSNPAGQKSRIFLPDGSTAWLNAESRIGYLTDFADSSRDIYLDGEAYFDVVHDAARPFRVHAGGLEVIALGTVFNVRSYDGDRQTTVSLIQGKVGVQAANFYEVINPGEGISLVNKLGFDVPKITKMKVDVAREVAWKDGVLVFDGDPIANIVRILERWYGVDIDVQGVPGKDTKYYGKFKNENLENVLAGMQYGYPFHYDIKGRKVKINFGTP